jgi:uncharacterized membrane protein YeaQ/YmgE (transglycosylase-associated protein family)
MDASVISLIVSLISGVVGGNIAGPAMQDKNLGPVVNSLAGLIGGGAGEFILRAAGIVTAATAAANTGAAPAGGFDLTQLLAAIGTGGVSGGVLTAIITAIKGAVAQK